MLLEDANCDVIDTNSEYSRGPIPFERPPTAVILAAGRGSRLKRQTSRHPKCLATVGGRSLIEHQLLCLEAMGIERIFVAAGYRAGQVYDAVGNRAAVIKNELWDSTNSLYSLWLTRHWIAGPLIVLNCDVLMHPEILARVLSAGGDAFAFDSSSGDDDEHMKVRVSHGYLREMSKTMATQHVDGENVGLLYFRHDSTASLFQHAEHVLATRGKTVWMAEAVQRVAQGKRVLGVDVYDLPWVEIDYQEDLDLARNTTWPAICERPWTSKYQEIDFCRVCDLSDPEMHSHSPSKPDEAPPAQLGFTC